MINNLKQKMKQIINNIGSVKEQININNSDININGNNITISSNSKNISIINGRIFIDGKEQTLDKDIKTFNITINGNIDKLDIDYCESINITGDVNECKSTNGNINITGDIKSDCKTTNGNVKANNIFGSVKTVNGDIKKNN
jgi:hypothetical protein